MIRRFLYFIFLCVGGIVFAIPKWILMGTRGSRDRKKMLKQQRKLVKRTPKL